MDPNGARRRQHVSSATRLLQGTRLRPVALASGLAALASLMSLTGCSEPAEVGVRKAIEQFPIDMPAVAPLGMVKDLAEEVPIRRRLAAYDSEEAVRIIDRIYDESEDPAVKAKALAGSRLLLADNTPYRVRLRVLALARKGFASDDVRVAFHGLRVLHFASDGQPEDVQRVQERLETTQAGQIIELGYIALGDWRAYAPIVKQILCPSPPKADQEAYWLWRIRTESAVGAWTAVAPRGEPIAADVARRFIDLMRQDLGMAEVVARSLVATRATQMVPQIKAKVYAAGEPVATRAIAGAAILALMPQEDDLRQELPAVLKEFFRARGDSPQDRVDLHSVIGWLAKVAGKSGDSVFADSLWDALGQADEAEREWFLVAVLFALSKDEAGTLHLLSRIQDADLRGLLASSRALQFVLRGGLLREDIALALPRQGTASREATEQRVRAMLDGLSR